MIEPLSHQRRGATGGRAAGHQNRLDGTLRKSGSSLVVVGLFVDESAGRPALAHVIPCSPLKRQPRQLDSSIAEKSDPGGGDS